MATGWKAYAEELSPGTALLSKGRVRVIAAQSNDGSRVTVTFLDNEVREYRPNQLVTMVIPPPAAAVDGP